MDWLIIENGEARANEILDDIDRRLARHWFKYFKNN
jgi:hypothetical protein